MTWRVDDHVLPLRRSKRNLRRIDRDVLFLLLEQGIEEKSILKLHPLRRAGVLDAFDFSFRQRIRVVQNPTDQSRLPVINMANENNLERFAFAVSQETLCAKFLHRVTFMMVLRAAGALARSRRFQFGNDLVDRARRCS